MKINKRKENNVSNVKSKSRREFIKKVGIGIVATSTYSLISLTNFSCADSVSPNNDFNPSNYSGYGSYT